jgi:TolA-binding protein
MTQDVSGKHRNMNMRQLQLVRPLLLAAAMVAASLAGVPAQAQIESREGIELRDQIAELRHELEMLRDQVAHGAGGSALGTAARPSNAGNDMLAQLLVRVDQLEEQTRQLRGRIDELQNQLQRQTADLGKRIDDLAFLVQNPEAAAAARQAAQAAGAAAPSPPAAGGTTTMSPPPGTLGTLPAQPPGAPPAAPRTPEVAMQEGIAALARRDYATAEAVAREVLTSSRTSPRAYDAQFLLAQAQFGQRQYAQAALSFDDTYNRARKGAHAEDALFGLANSLAALNDKSSACQALAKLHAEFPTPRADLRAPIAAAAQRNGCR